MLIGYTDLSNYKIGCTDCLARSVDGVWVSVESCHINLLEVTAFLVVLQHLKPSVSEGDVLVRTDNKTMVTYINGQGRICSAPLLEVAENLWRLVMKNLQSVKAL